MINRFYNLLGKALFYFVLAVVVLEAGARLIGFEPRLYTRPYDPIFVSGHHFADGVRSERAQGSSGHPRAYGYAADFMGNYTYRGRAEKPRDQARRTDFLFDHIFSRYDAAQVDEIICNNNNALSIFVLGGSAAQGVGASDREKTWHGVLEGKLRRTFDTDDIHVFNAAIGGFNSLQERLAFHLAVAPRAPDIVLVLDGFNDVVLPLNTASRPGDAYQTGTRYTKFYGNSLLQYLAEVSAFANAVSNHFLYGKINAVRDGVDEDDQLFDAYKTSVVGEYIRNTQAILKNCALNGYPCLVAIQPFRAISHEDTGVPLASPPIISAARFRDIYDTLIEKAGTQRYAENYVDLSRLFSAPDRLGVYTDYVHFNDRGNAILADALLPHVARLVESIADRPQGAKDWCDNPQ